MSPLVWLALGLTWLIDMITGALRAVIARRRQAQRHVLAQARSVPVAAQAAPPSVVDPARQHRAAMHELHRRRAEEQMITTLLGSIDTAHYPVRWRDAQRMAAHELGATEGLVFVERARLRFIELGGGEMPPFVAGQRVLHPVAAANDDALAPDDEAVAARLLGWLVEKEERC